MSTRSPRNSAADDLIRSALKDGPRISRFIQNSLFYDHDIAPTTVTDRLAHLSKTSAIFKRAFPYRGSDRGEAHLYGLKRLTTADAEKAAADIAFRDEVLDSHELGEAGQRYLYGLLQRLDDFVMPRKDRLGKYIGKDGILKIDLSAFHKYHSQFVGSFLFEVKNEIQVFHPSSLKLFKLVRDAIAESAVPFFVASHMTPDTIIACHALGIRTLHLRRQIIPKTYNAASAGASARPCHTKPVVERLRSTILGPAPYEFIGKRFYQDGLTAEAARDLDALRGEIESKVTITNWEENLVGIERAIKRGASWSEIRNGIPCERHWRRAIQMAASG